MSLVKPALTNVNPGQPLTAQAWNAMLSAIGALYDAVLAIGGNTVDVELRNGATPVTAARVTAVRASSAPVAAVPPRASGTAFTLTGLTAGTWTVHVDAPGFQPASAQVTVPGALPPINLVPNTVAMPDLLGQTTVAALAALKAAAIEVDLLLDITGNEVSRSAVPAGKASARILFQFPLPGMQVTAATVRTRLVLSADVEDQLTVVPDFTGMSLKKLELAIKAARLTLGKVTQKKVPGPPPPPPESESLTRAGEARVRDIDTGAVILGTGAVATAADVVVTGLVFSQSVAPETRVPIGTPIDIEFMDPAIPAIKTMTDLPLEWIQPQLTIGAVAANVSARPEILTILQNHQTAATLSPAEQQVLVAFGKSLGVNVNVGDPASLNGAFTVALRAHQLSSIA